MVFVGHLDRTGWLKNVTRHHLLWKNKWDAYWNASSVAMSLKDFPTSWVFFATFLAWKIFRTKNFGGKGGFGIPGSCQDGGSIYINFKSSKQREASRLGIGNSVEGFKCKFMIHRHIRYCCFRGQGYCCFSVSSSLRLRFAWEAQFLWSFMNWQAMFIPNAWVPRDYKLSLTTFDGATYSPFEIKTPLTAFKIWDGFKLIPRFLTNFWGFKASHFPRNP